jgi:hypothetical protein
MNADAQFKDFVARQQRPASADNAPDWDRERDEWLSYLQQLYDLIAEYLDEYIKSGAIELRRSPIELNEENIGVYEAQRLTIVIGKQEILLTPIGTRLIESKGRVDVEGSAAKSRLVLVDKEITDARRMVRVTLTTIQTVSPSTFSLPLTIGEIGPERPPSGPRDGPEVPRLTIGEVGLEPPPSTEKIEWAWKIVTRPPNMQFIELNRETFFEMLMEVSNG